MNKKVSGGQSVIVRINNIGKNYLPFVENLKDRVIKYIDVDTANDKLPDGSNNAYNGTLTDSFITLIDKNGFVINHNNYPLYNLNNYRQVGDRPFFGRKMSLQNSYINITDASMVGKSMLLVFWYDEPEYSARNTTNNISVETIEVPYNNAFKNLMPDNRTLAGKRVRRILFDYVTTTPSFSTCANVSEHAEGYITLNNGNTAILKQVPIASLYKYFTSNVYDLEFANIKFDLTNSWIELPTTTPITPGQKWLVRLAYEN